MCLAPIDLAREDHACLTPYKSNLMRPPTPSAKGLGVDWHVIMGLSLLATTNEQIAVPALLP